MPQFCLDEVNKVSHREYYTGFYFGPSANGQHYGDSQYIRDYEVVGMPVDCREDGTAVFALKNRFFKGEGAGAASAGSRTPIASTPRL